MVCLEKQAGHPLEEKKKAHFNLQTNLQTEHAKRSPSKISECAETNKWNKSVYQEFKIHTPKGKQGITIGSMVKETGTKPALLSSLVIPDLSDALSKWRQARPNDRGDCVVNASSKANVWAAELEVLTQCGETVQQGRHSTDIN